MSPIAAMCRSIWWAVAIGGVAALVAAAVVGLGLVAAPRGAAAWQLVAGVALVAATARAPGGVARALPFLGGAVAGLVLGVAGLLVPALDPRISLIAIGIWSVVAAAGYLAVARIARALGVPDGGLYTTAWLGIAVGVAVSTLPAFGLGASALAPAAAMGMTGVVSIAASLRLRVLPGEPPPVLSGREARRRERAARNR
jgi:hypothetical protein